MMLHGRRHGIAEDNQRQSSLAAGWGDFDWVALTELNSNYCIGESILTIIYPLW